MDPTSGGPCQGIRNNISFWKKGGIFPDIFSLDSPDEKFIQEERIIALGPAKNSWRYTKILIPFLEKKLPKYDAVLVHGLWLFHGFAVLIALKKIIKKKGTHFPKLYVMPHGMLDPYFQKANERRLKAFRNVIYWHLIEKRLINSAEAIFFTCEEEMFLAKTTFSDYHPKHTFNVGYGIEAPPAFKEEQKAAFETICPAIKGKKYLLFLSRIHHKKGVDLLLKAYSKILNKHNIDFDLVIAGPGEMEVYGKSMKALKAELGLNKDRVHFTGMLKGDPKWGAIYGAEGFILPSHQENFGIAVVEAMACKKAVLISNKVNIWREIAEGEGGIVNEDDLAGTIASLEQWVGLTQEQQTQIGINAHNIYLEKFTAEATSKKFVEVLTKGFVE
jgi:glycosyltransferase involved in cell wall biosynthesis